jgi:hypothetical protein
VKLDEYNQFKKRVDAKQREADKARGAFEAAMASIKKLYGVTTLGKAKTLLAEMNHDLTVAEKEYDEAYEQFIKDNPEFN